MIFLSFLLVLMFIFPNTLFFSMSLIVFSLLVVMEGVFLLYLTPLVAILLVTIYIGAVMILFGYICSICPNPNLSSSFYVFYFFFPFSFFLNFFSFPISSSSSSPFFFLYSSKGFFLLIFIFLFLLVVLLMVTSHHNTINGPFRSL